VIQEDVLEIPPNGSHEVFIRTCVNVATINTVVQIVDVAYTGMIINNNSSMVYKDL